MLPGKLRWTLLALLAATVAAVILLPAGPSHGSACRRVLIADALAADYPNPELIQFITRVLESKGFSVDYLAGAEVNLSVYARLTEYALVVIRTHGGIGTVDVGGRNVTLVGLFTGVKWSNEYAPLMRRGLVAKAEAYASPGTYYVAVLPKFLREELKGSFCPGSVVVVASCYSLAEMEVPAVLAEKGLSFIVGWRGEATVEEIDYALKRLIELVYIKGLSWPDAVKVVAGEIEERFGRTTIMGLELEVVSG